MRWTPGGMSDDVEDRRGEGGSPRGMGFGGGGGGMRLGLGGILILGVLSVVFKQDFLSMFLGGDGGGVPMEETGPQQPAASDPRETRSAQFVSFVLDDLQNTWTKLLPETGTPYRRAKLVLFRDSIQSACGFAESASGPFYCPGDRKVYIDLGFFDELSQKFGAPGEFAQAYVIAHEIGHHIQRITGIEGKVRRLQQSNPGAQNPLSVRLELQADCLAGVWGHSTAQRNLLDPGDVEQGLRAAAAIGDDRIQRSAGRAVSPESFTHGSAAQRVEWLKRGLTEGRTDACNTFAEGAVR